jgi:hypothetical protein
MQQMNRSSQLPDNVGISVAAYPAFAQCSADGSEQGSQVQQHRRGNRQLTAHMPIEFRGCGGFGMTVVLSVNPVLAYFSCSKPVTLYVRVQKVRFSAPRRLNESRE